MEKFGNRSRSYRRGDGNNRRRIPLQLGRILVAAELFRSLGVTALDDLSSDASSGRLPANELQTLRMLSGNADRSLSLEDYQAM